MTDEITQNLLEVRQRVEQAAVRSGRNRADCELLVVSKTWPAEFVSEVVAQGQLSFGENRLQEAEVKIPQLPDHLRWHLIGHLQRNKVRKALPLFDVIHSIDSLKLAKYTSKLSTELARHPDVYLEVNLAAEENKAGYSPDELLRELDELLVLEGFNIHGLMCIPPVVATPEEARPWFVKLRELREEVEARGGRPLPGLSMGMSGDYEVAIEEGSTVVRVGSAIFGARKNHGHRPPN